MSNGDIIKSEIVTSPNGKETVRRTTICCLLKKAKDIAAFIERQKAERLAAGATRFECAFGMPGTLIVFEWI